MNVIFDGSGYWIDPNGKLYYVEEDSHPVWAAKHLRGNEQLKPGDSWEAFQQLAEMGWRRVVAETESYGSSKTIYVSCGPLNRAQRSTLETAAINQEARLVLDVEGAKRSTQVIYEPPRVSESRLRVDLIFEKWAKGEIVKIPLQG